MTGINQFLAGLNGSAYLTIADQYMFGQKATTTFGGNLFDPSSPPENNQPSFGDIGNRVCGFLKKQGIAFDPANIYIYIAYASIYPATDTAYCAFHGYSQCEWNRLHVAYVPNATNIRDCLIEGEDSLDPYLTPNTYSPGTRSMVNVTAHEFTETITDPNLDAWYDPNGNEIGDLCDSIFQNWVPLTNSNWKVQEEWSNQVSGCAQGALPMQLLGASSSSSTVTTFNIPSATYGIFGASINGKGAIAGAYYDTNSLPFACFLRDPLGNITAFSVPGALYTDAWAINSNGTMGGSYADASGPTKRFLARSAR